jgi:GT2 family glycosyltransferase
MSENNPPVELSAIIVNWNTKLLLHECLESLCSHPPLRPMEVIVVDNASVDGSCEMVESCFPQVKLMRNSQNVGFARANNMAIEASVGKYVALVNSDVRVLPGCLDALADFLDRNPSVGNVGPRVLNSDFTLQASARNFPSLWNNFCTAIGLAAAFPLRKCCSGEPMLYFDHARTRCVDVLVGCFWLLRRTALEQIGMLDEDFFMYGEDLDWCRRCWDAGWEIVFCPDAEAIHHRGRSSAAHPVRAAVTQQRSVLHYWDKHHGAAARRAIRSVFFCRYAIRYVVGICGMKLRIPGERQGHYRIEVSKACVSALLSGMDQHGGRIAPVVKSP